MVQMHSSFCKSKVVFLFLNTCVLVPVRTTNPENRLYRQLGRPRLLCYTSPSAISMEKFGEALWPLHQIGYLETEENISMMNNHCDKLEEEDKKEQGGQEEEEGSRPKIIPTYAPQEPREEEADDEEEGESSISTDLHSWYSMPMPPSHDPLEAYESKRNDAETVFVDWTKEIPTEEEAVFCERYWEPSAPQTSSSTVRQKVSSLNNFRAVRCNKRSFSHQFSGEGYRQRKIKRGFNQSHSDSVAAATFHRGVQLDKGPANRSHYHKEHHGSKDSFSNPSSRRRQNVYRTAGLGHGTMMTMIQHHSSPQPS